MGGKTTTKEERAMILSLREENVPLSEICRLTGRHKATVLRVLAAARGLPPGVIPSPRPRPGPSRKTSIMTDQLLKREAAKNPLISPAELKQMYPELLKNVSQRTISRRLQKDFGLPSRQIKVQPMLTQKWKAERIVFAKKYQQWSEEDWLKVLFSNESTFRVIHVRVKAGRVRRLVQGLHHRIGSNISDLQYTVQSAKDPDYVIAWGVFSGAEGAGGLYFLPRNLTTKTFHYLDILNKHLLPFYEKHKGAAFLCNGASYHKDKVVSAFLEKADVPVLDWPDNSPDLNPMENCWDYLKSHLTPQMTSSVTSLKDGLTKLWQALDKDYLVNLCRSMPRRLEQVIKHKGEMTKYYSKWKDYPHSAGRASTEGNPGTSKGTPKAATTRTPKSQSPDKFSGEQDPLADSSTEQDPLADSSVGQELLLHESDYEGPIAEEELLYHSEEEDPLTPSADPLATHDLKVSSEEEDTHASKNTADDPVVAPELPNIDIVKEEIESDLEEGVEVQQLMEDTSVREKEINAAKDKAVYPITTSATTFGPQVPSKPKKRKKIPSDEQDQQPLVSSVTELCNRLSATENGDEFHQFGLNVAAQLRAMPLRAALEAQLDIQKILTTKRFQFMES